MKFSKKDVMDFVRKAFGDNATEVLIDRYTIDENDNPYDFTIFLDKNCQFPLVWSHNEEFLIASGCSKLVIVPKNRSYVIKIPWTGCYIEDFDEDNDKYTYHYDYEITYCPMEDEKAIYDMEITEDTKQFFAENEFVGLYNDSIPIYVQEKVLVGMNNEVAQKVCSASFTHKMHSYYKNLPAKIIKFIVEQVGYSRGEEVINEINDIDDLHSENFGFDKYGNFKIIDYAGYDSENYFAYNN
jgi:hypothetical protein